MQRLRFRLLALAAAVAGFGLVAPPTPAHAARPPMGSTKSSRPAASKPGAKPKSPRPAAASSRPSSSAKIGLTELPKAKLQMGRALGRKVKNLEARKIRGFELEPERPRHGGDWYPVTYAGLRMKRADDADGTDEPAVWLAFVRRVGTRYEKTVQRVPASTAIPQPLGDCAASGAARSSGAPLLRHTQEGTHPDLLLSAI